MSNFFIEAPTVPSVRPAIPIGAGLDIPTGEYYEAADGRMVLNGGLFSMVVIAGPMNTFKSTILHYMHCSAMNRMSMIQCGIYDTESTFKWTRLNSLCQRYDNLSHMDHSDITMDPSLVRFWLTSEGEIKGDQYFELIKKGAKGKQTNKKSVFTTPFIDHNGKAIKIKPPTIVCFDSFSAFSITSVDNASIEENEVGHKGNKTRDLNLGAAKKQLIQQIPNMHSNMGMYFTMSVHTGNSFDELGGQYAVKQPKLTYQKNGTKMVGAVKALEWWASVIYEIQSVQKLNMKTGNASGGARYPLIASDKQDDCVDLLLITLRVIRNKNGLSGSDIDLVVSQREGVLPHLSQFHHIKDNNHYGIDGDDKTYNLVLVPEISLSRTKVRWIIDSIYKVRRAIEILSGMLQICQLWKELPGDVMCTPKELHNDIIALGYDWDWILNNTQEYYVPEENTYEKKYELSVYDLLRIRKGKYLPKWLKKRDVVGDVK